MAAAGVTGARLVGAFGRHQITGILPTDHYVLRKLHGEVLPWIAVSRHVNTQWFVIFARGDSYLKEIAAALAGLGIGVPLTAWIAGKSSGTGAAEELRKTFPGIWLFIGIVALIIYLILRAVIHLENVTEKAIFARDCARTIKGLSVELTAALPDANPMPRIIQIQKSLDAAVSTATKNDVWPYDPLSPPSNIIQEVDELTDTIRKKFMPNWTPPPPEERKIS